MFLTRRSPIAFRHFSTRSTIAFSFCCALSLFAAPVEPLKIEQQPTTVERRAFDPANPPPELERADEAAFCGYVFEVECILTTYTPRSAAGPAIATVTNVNISTRLHITIGTPEGGAKEYVAHEETHRAIADFYYRRAREVARRLGAPLLGKKLLLPMGYSKAAADAAIKQVRKQFFADYMRETHDRCDFAQNRFDVITDHGRNAIPNSEALERALAEEERFWDKPR